MGSPTGVAVHRAVAALDLQACPIRVLLVEESLDYAARVRAALTRAKNRHFQLEHVKRLSAALLRLERETFDVLLLGLSSPGAGVAFSIGCACALANHLPIIVLTRTEDDELGMTAVKAGAQEYLVKNRLDRRALPTTILHSIVRHQRMSMVATLRRPRSRDENRPLP